MDQDAATSAAQPTPRPTGRDCLGKRKRSDEHDVVIKREREQSPPPVSFTEDAVVNLEIEDDMFEPGECQWSESKESFPVSPAYDPRFEAIAKGLVSCIGEIKAIFAANPCQTDAVNSILEKIPEIETIPDTPNIRIALLGDAGAGMCFGML